MSLSVLMWSLYRCFFGRFGFILNKKYLKNQVYQKYFGTLYIHHTWWESLSIYSKQDNSKLSLIQSIKPSNLERTHRKDFTLQKD